jgi:putative endonuclease
MFQVYTLYSSKFDEIYIGYSTNAKKRLASHNHEKNKGYTKRYQPWEMVFTEEFETRLEAMKREKELKTSKGREFVWKEVKKKFA